jgi:outer membrane biosynthesis protein TonB
MFGQVILAEEKIPNSTDMGLIKPDATQFASMGTELGSFQHKLYLLIGSKWNLKVQQTMEKIGEGRVVIKFHVNPDGKITDINIAEGTPEEKLAIISKEAVGEGSLACGQFSDALKKEKPNGFDWQLPFRIY